MAFAVAESDVVRATRADLAHIIAERRITTYFQPIIDLFFGEVYSYEALSRAEPPFECATDLFTKAREWGLSWELEAACRSVALDTISSTAHQPRARRFFINVSPSIFTDPRFRPDFAAMDLRGRGIDQRQIVFEITESSCIADYAHFEQLVRHYVDQGIHIALDDFGAGHSSMVMLMAACPQFVKLDRALVANIHKDAYKQNLVKALLSFMSSVESKLVAEGVEKIEELEALLRLGVRYAQGYLFARPAPELSELREDIRRDIKGLMRRFHYPKISLSTQVSSIVLRPPVFEVRTTTCEELDYFFRRNPSADHVLVLDQGKPCGLVPKQHFYSIAGGRYGFQLIQKKYIETVAVTKHEPLVVEEGMDIMVLGRLAMERGQDDLYDPVIVTDTEGVIVGTITMKQLLTQSIRTEVQLAASANPLTGLPGNTMIQSWLQEVLQTNAFWIIYGDLDHFKEFNDSYGFPQGDQMIKLAAKVLTEQCPKLSMDARLGHVGGDDFIIVTQGNIDVMALQSICSEFDRQKIHLFNVQDVESGSYKAVSRTGETISVPLVTLSLAVISSENLEGPIYPGKFGQIAASLKKKIKTLNAATRQSGFLIERRHNP